MLMIARGALVRACHDKGPGSAASLTWASVVERARTRLRHRFPLLMYSSLMAVLAAPIAMQSTYPVGLATLVVLIFLAGLAAAGYFIGRRYLETRPNRRNWR
jgi:hypothetical protein